MCCKVQYLCAMSPLISASTMTTYVLLEKPQVVAGLNPVGGWVDSGADWSKVTLPECEMKWGTF